MLGLLKSLTRSSSQAVSSLGAVRVLATPVSSTGTPLVFAPCQTGRISMRKVSFSASHYTAQQQTDPETSGRNSQAGGSESHVVKELKDMPGPWKIPLLGITPEFAKIDPKKSIHYLNKLPLKYGNIFRLKLGPGLPEFVCVYDPKDAATVFRSEVKYPQRMAIDIWVESRTALGKPVGLFLAKGENWHKQRNPISKFMLVPRKVAEYYEPFNEVAIDLVTSIRRSRDESGMLIDVPSSLYKWSFESVNMFVLGKRLGCLEEQIPADCQEFIDQTHKFLSVSQKMLFGLPFHKIYATRNYKELLNSFQRIFDISMGYIKERLEEIKEEDVRAVENGMDQEAPVGVDFLTYMSHADKMPLEMITTNAIDLLAAGIDTTSMTLLWTLYALAVNPETQDKLRKEVQSVVGSDNLVTPSHIQQMPFLRDCLREALRMYSIAPNNTRILEQDVILSGYRVPAGTCVLLPIIGAGAQPENFPEPEKYKPERWSRDNKDVPNMFASLPFGFGTRMCVGRRVAELELHIALAQLIKTFRVEFRDEKPMDYVQDLFLSPERRFDLAFIDL